MKTLQLITGIALMGIFSLTSCQSEIEEVQGDNPNTANSTAATNLKRVSMFDGSSDDFLDDSSCSSIVFPYVVKINGIQVSISSQTNLEAALSIIGAIDDDAVELQFPVKIKMSDYTVVTVNSQSEYDEITENCSESEDAISSINIKFPITMLSFDSSLQLTGSVVIKSEEELYLYMKNMTSTELFSIQYPITVTLSGSTSQIINSEAEFKAAINAALDIKSKMEVAEDNKEKLEAILVNGTFKVSSYIVAGVESVTSYYLNKTIDFTNDWKVKSMETLTTVASGTYSMKSETDVYLQLDFTSNTNFTVFNKSWKVTSFTASTITLQSTTNSAVTLVLKQI
ncbi:hypothetical protein [Flavobacterium flavipallidum]|uniref:Lipoprotein n=1 Tax=Flavobacterium flavipallidum TaxID=3139140 RepID=A0ABU9HL01_9FLAO